MVALTLKKGALWFFLSSLCLSVLHYYRLESLLAPFSVQSNLFVHIIFVICQCVDFLFVAASKEFYLAT